jgi:hypothetical protein
MAPLLTKINTVLHTIGKYLNVINTITGLFIGLAYVYLPFPSIPGLVFGIIMVLSSTATMGISYYFTSKNTLNPKEQNHPEKKSFLSASTKARLFLSLAVPFIFINTVANFIGSYMGILLLAGALALPIAPPAVIAIAVIVAALFTIGTLLNSWLQTHNIWQGLKETKDPTPTSVIGLNNNEEPSSAKEYKEEFTQTEALDRQETPSLPQSPKINEKPPLRESLNRRLSLFPDSSSSMNIDQHKGRVLAKEEDLPRSYPVWSSLK